MIQWPALIKFSGDDELLYISTRAEWESDPDLHSTSYEEGDRLIDSLGMVYTLHYHNGESRVKLAPEHNQVSVAELCTLLKSHFLCLQQCCVPKFHISSYAEGMRMLES